MFTCHRTDTESNCKMDSKDTTLAGLMARFLVSITFFPFALHRVAGLSFKHSDHDITAL